jgi:2,3-bisphosphoglycerate-independent phosphoglycerate mutase
VKKIVYVILDGVGDRPVSSLGGRTPLEASIKPHLDALAREGRQGVVTTVGAGIAPESDVAVTAMLGYDPHKYHAGRGLLEALGLGLKFEDGDVALRGNFASGGAGRTILDRRVGRNLSSEEAHALAASVNRGVRLDEADFHLAASIGHRCVLVLYDRVGRLSAQIGNTDPAYGRIGGLGVAKANAGNVVEPCAPLEDTPAARRAAELVNAFTARARETLDGDPVNAARRAAGKLPGNLILLRDASDHVPSIEPFASRFGARAACFVEMPVERGIARMLGMGIVDVPASGKDTALYEAWADRAVASLDAWDLLYIHLKGPDEPGHDGDAAAKRASIEGIDRHFFGRLLPRVDLTRTLVAVTADHATPCEAGAHTDDPVPLVVSGAGVAPDGAGAYGESAGRRGGLGHLAGVEIVPLLAKLAT